MINLDVDKTVKKEEIISLISKKGSNLVMEQLKTLLESKTKKMEDELNYLKDRLDKANITLKRRNDLIEELEPRVIQTANMQNEFRLERDALAAEIKKLEGIEEKTFQITERNTLIESKADRVGKLAEKQRKLHRKFNENLRKKEKIVKELTENIERLNSLDKVITALRAKKEVLVSKIPESSGPNDFKAKEEEAEKDVLKYKTETTRIKRQLTVINKKLPPLEKQAEKKAAAQDALFAERNALRDRLAELETVENREVLTAEVNELKEHNESLAKDIEDKRSDLGRIVSEIAEAEESIEKENAFTSTAGPRLEELAEQKAEIDDIENVLKMINLNIAVNKKFQEIASSVTDHLGPLNESLGSLSRDYKAEINKIIKKVKKNGRKSR